MTKIKHRISKKRCPFHEARIEPYYRDVDTLSRYVSERKKILPAIYTGVCAKHQRKLTTAIKQARHLALIPFVATI
jgi:small subunit ribosomal protein S18